VGIAADPTNRYAYVTDYASNQLIGYSIMGGNTLTLSPTALQDRNEPSAVIIDQRGKFIYVTNSLDSSVSAYAIDLATALRRARWAFPAPAAMRLTPSRSPSRSMRRWDVCLYRNYLGNSVSGFRLDPTSAR